MLISNNPAARLLNLINQGRKYQNQDEQAHKVWSHLLKVPEDDKAKLLKRIGFVMALPLAIKKQIKNIENYDSDIYLKKIPVIEQALSALNFQIQWKHFMAHFDPSVVLNLEICAEVLARKRSEKTIEQEYLDEILYEIDSLLQVALSNGNENAFNRFIIKSLLNIKNAIEEYGLLGSEPLEKELQASFGVLATNSSILNKSKESESGQKFLKILGRISLVLGIAVSVQILGPSVQKLLLPEQSLSQTGLTTHNNNEAEIIKI